MCLLHWYCFSWPVVMKKSAFTTGHRPVGMQRPRPRPRLSLADLCRVARPFCCCCAGDRKMNYTNPFIYLYTYLSNTPNFIGFEIWFISGWLTAKKVIEWERTNKSGERRAASACAVHTVRNGKRGNKIKVCSYSSLTRLKGPPKWPIYWSLNERHHRTGGKPKIWRGSYWWMAVWRRRFCL